MSLIAGNLGIVQRLLDEHTAVWGICGGAASHLYGNRRPIRNIDILVSHGTIRTVMELMQAAKRIGQFDGRRIMWSGVNIFDNLSFRDAEAEHPFTLDLPMIGHLRSMQLLGSRVMVLSPEDVMAHRMLFQRSQEYRTNDYEDVVAIAQRQKLDLDYLKERLRLFNARALLKWYEQEYTEEQKVPEPSFFGIG